MAGIPLLVYGQILESGSGVDAVTVKLRNDTTNDVATGTADSNGIYIFDLSDDNDFPNGWQDGQQITVYTIFKNFDGQTTFTIDLPTYGYEQNITLSSAADSELIDYASVQDVFDELDAKTSSDISTSRIISAIQRAEGLIDMKSGTSFKKITVTQETHSVDRYSIETSPVFEDTISPPFNNRLDFWRAGIVNRVRTDFGPIISISVLQRNSAGFNASDSFTTLTQQTGSGGDYFIADSDARIIDFVNNYPRFGDRSWRVTYIYGYDPASTDRRVVSLLNAVERLTVLLATKSIITTKTTGAMFDSTRDVKIGAIEIKAGAMSGGQYLRSIEPEITELWKVIGELSMEVI